MFTLSNLGSKQDGVRDEASCCLQLNDAPLAIVDKRRSAHNVSEVMNLIGDVKGKVAVLVDDMIDTAGTITNAAKVAVLLLVTLPHPVPRHTCMFSLTIFMWLSLTYCVMSH